MERILSELSARLALEDRGEPAAPLLEKQIAILRKRVHPHFNAGA